MGKTIKVGIAAQEKIRDKLLAIAKGELKVKPSDPKIWFTSMRSLSQVLSVENRALLKAIRESKPDFITALAGLIYCLTVLPNGPIESRSKGALSWEDQNQTTHAQLI